MDSSKKSAFSYIFHPAIIPTFISAVLLFFMRGLSPIALPVVAKLYVLLMVVLFTLVFPFSLIFLLYRLNLISDIRFADRKQRTLPLLVMASAYLMMLVFFRNIYLPPVLVYIYYAYTVTVLVGIVINIFYKISFHALGWSALITAIYMASLRLGSGRLLLLLFCSIIFGGFAGYAQLKEDSHTPWQVYSGYIMGFLIIGVISALNF